MGKLKLLVFFIIISLGFCLATNRSQLFKDFLDSYEVRVAPFDTASDSITLSVGLILMSIRKVSEKDQTFSASFWISMTWGDNRLIWDPTSYNSITQIQTTSKSVWIPSSICIFNDVTNNKCLTEEKPVIIYNYGYVTYITSRESVTKCKIDITKYPFDSQTCSLYFGNFFVDSEFIALSSTHSVYDLTYFDRNEEWNVQGASVVEHHVSAKDKQLLFHLNMKRKPDYIVLTVLLPVIILSVLNIFCFVLPIDSGEKMGTSMAIFLTFAVFLTVINDTMPKSDDIPPFTVYLTIQLVISGLTVILEIIVLHVHFWSTDNSDTNKVEPGECDVKEKGDVTEKGDSKVKRFRRIINLAKENLTAKVLDRIFMVLVIIVDFISLIILFAKIR